MSKIRDTYWEENSPKGRSKRKIRRYILKNMMGKTKKERFINFFANRKGFYSWKEMCTNYSIIFCLVFFIITLVFLIVFADGFSILDLASNIYITLFSASVFFLFILFLSKRKQRRRRFECFINNGISDKYVFWKDDKTNPSNKKTYHSFD